MADRQTRVLGGNGTSVQAFTLDPGLLQYVQSVFVEVDNSGGGDIAPTLTVQTNNGQALAKKQQGRSIPAGDSGSATWALRLDDERASDYVLIASQVLTVAAARLTFSGIPQTFRHLELVAELLSPNGDTMAMTFNGDPGNTGTDYTIMQQWWRENASSMPDLFSDPSSSSGDFSYYAESELSQFEWRWIPQVTNVPADAATRSALHVWMPWYTRPFHKNVNFTLTGITESFAPGDDPRFDWSQGIGVYLPTAPITRVDLKMQSAVDTLSAGVRASLYGIR